MKFQVIFENIKLKMTLFLFLLSVRLIIGQQSNYQFEYFGYEEGPNASTNSIVQDTRGFIWFGTSHGLVKYNGYEFESFLNISDDSTSISNNYINCIAEDDKLNLWIGTQNGLNKFNPFTKISTQYFYHPKEKTSLSDSYITSLYIDGESKLWVGTQKGGLNKTDLNDDELDNSSKLKFHHYLNNPLDDKSISNNHITSILEISEQNQFRLWIATIEGLNILDKISNKFERYFHEPKNKNSLPSNRLKTLFVDKDKNMWIGTNNGHISLVNDCNNILFENYYTNRNGLIISIKEDINEQLWIGDRLYGLLKFNKKSKSFYKQPRLKKDEVKPDEIRSIFFDNQQRMWVASRWGLHKFDPNDKQFNYQVIKPPKDLWVLWPTGFCKDKNGELWVATKGKGILRYKTFPGNSVNYLPKKNDKGSLSSKLVTQIVCTREGTIWIGTDNGLDRYDPSSDSFIHYKEIFLDNDPNFLTNEFINTLYVDSKDNLWIGSAGGVSKYNKKDESFIHYLNDKKQLHKIGFYVGAIYEDANGKMWVGANSLYKFDPSKNKISKYLENKNYPGSGIDHMVYSILEDDDSNLWIGTFEGLYCLNNRDSLKHFTIKDGLPSNITYGIVKDDNGFLWIETFKGMIRYKPQDNVFKKFYFHGNFLQNEFAVKGFYKDLDGNFYFGQANRITYFHPSAIKVNSNLVPVIFTNIKVSDKNINFDKPISEVDVVEFSHKENRLDISWVGLTYTNTNKVKYAYKFDGFNEEWIYCNERRDVTYSNINPGEYIFKVKASNDDGIWNQQFASLNIIITPAWWATWWFRTISIFILFAIGYLMYRYRVNQLLALERMRVQIASDLHDDVGSSLTKIAIHSEIIKNTEDKSKVTSSSAKIGTMSREIISSLSDIIWSIDARNDKVGDLIDRMRDYLESVFPSGKVTTDFQTHGIIFENNIDQELRQNIYLIFKEAVNNTSKHSAATEVKIRMTNGSGKFRLEIKDNGKGFEFDDKRSYSHGLQNMKLRAKRINGDLKIENRNGTKIILIVEEL